MDLRGKLSIEDLKKNVESGGIETIIVAFTDHYGRLMGKRYDAEFFLETILESGSHACDYLLTTDMEMEPVPGYEFANWELGYGDFHLKPDMKSLREADWLEKTALVLCDVLDEKDDAPIEVAPRSILNTQLQNFIELEYHPFAATELEYYLLEFLN